MMKVNYLLLVLFFVVACSVTWCNGQNSNRMVIYYATWDTTGFKFLNLSGVPSYYTHVHIAFGCFSGGQVVFQTMPDNLNQFVQDIKTLQGRGQKVVLTMGGWTCDWEPVYSDVQGYAVKTYNFIQQYGFDGIDLDFEYMGYDTAPLGSSVNLIIGYMKTLRQLLPSNKLVILTPMASYVNPAVTSINQWNNAYIWVMNNLSSTLSYIQIMCYNNGADEDPYQNVIDWSEKFSIQNWEFGTTKYEGYDATKIVIGILADQAAGSTGYLTPSQVNQEITKIRQTYGSLAGVMMWDMQLDYNNPAGTFYQGNGVYPCVKNGNC